MITYGWDRCAFPHTKIPHGSTCLSKLPKTTIIATTITTDVKKLREKVNELRSRADAKAAKESERERARAAGVPESNVTRCECVCVFECGI